LAAQIYFAFTLVSICIGAGLVIVVRGIGFALGDTLYNLAIGLPGLAMVIGLAWLLASPLARRSRAIITAIVLAGAGFVVVGYLGWIL
jgi:hypothetical protein